MPEEPEPVVLPIEDWLDLHAFAPRDVPSVVEEYLREAAARGLGEVRLIHGRGKGVQRAVVQALLAGHPLVSRFFDAPAGRGGWGATVVMLKPGADPGPVGRENGQTGGARRRRGSGP
jgi:DNA-nicking Smr family endonuclease